MLFFLALFTRSIASLISYRLFLGVTVSMVSVIRAKLGGCKETIPKSAPLILVVGLVFGNSFSKRVSCSISLSAIVCSAMKGLDEACMLTIAALDVDI